MITRHLALLLFLSASIFCFGQTNPETKLIKDKLVDPYQKYFSLPREEVYTHFNKSTYVPGDDVWFKCYVFDPLTKLPSQLTKNLITELYDSRGKLVRQKILFVNNGTADNVFNLKIDANPGIYTFKAYTSWMQNFTDVDLFTARITVAGEMARDTLGGEMKYDVQFFPESGILLSGQFNKVAVKATDSNGKGIKLRGSIQDQNGDTASTVILNDLGMGEAAINALPNFKFICKMELPDGKIYEYPLPLVSEKGIVAQVNPFFKSKVLIRVASNEQTITSKRLFYLVIHDDGMIAKTALFYLDPDHSSQNISFDKADLVNGVNCLTVFDDHYQPVAERLFFVKNAEVQGKIRLGERRDGDSLALDIRVSDSAGQPAEASLSLSVLPEGTESNRFTNSLLSETLLKSGVKGFIENPMYYFEKEDFAHQTALDDLLLSQGWRKYDWKEILTGQSIALTRNFEQGFTVEGQIKNWLSGKMEKRSQVALFSPGNNIFDLMPVDSLGRFSFKNLYLADSSNVIVSAMSTKGKGWNRSVSSNITPKYIPDSVIMVPHNYIRPTQEMADLSPMPLIKGVIQLKEVKIIGQKKPMPFENSIYRPLNGRTYEITKENYDRYMRIDELLLAEFNVRLRRDSGGISVEMGRGPTSLFNPQPPVLIVDDMPMSDFSMLDILNVQEIEAISVNKGADAMLGMRGGAGSIMIKTRKIPIDWGSEQPSNLQVLKLKGYSNPIAYYTPKYALTPNSREYRKYASIFWKPNIETDSTGTATIHFEMPREINGLEIRLEGMAKNGTIFLEEKRLNLR